MVADKIVKAAVISSVQDAIQVVALPVAPIVPMDVTVDAKILVELIVKVIVQKNALVAALTAPADVVPAVSAPAYQDVAGLVLEL